MVSEALPGAGGKSRLLRSADVIAQPSGDMLILFQMNSGRYFSLNECGSRIWDACDGTRTGTEISGLLSKEYAAPPEFHDDIAALLAQLVNSGLAHAVDLN